MGQSSPTRSAGQVQRLCGVCNKPLTGTLRRCSRCESAGAVERVRIERELSDAMRHARPVRCGRARRDWIDRALGREY
jgi:hypothetical protein